MKAQILKIAGVKSEKEFYKKYPSEEAFMKAHGKDFKKAERGMKIAKAQNGYNTGGSGMGGLMDPTADGSTFGENMNYNNPGGQFLPNQQVQPVNQVQPYGVTPQNVPQFEYGQLQPLPEVEKADGFGKKVVEKMPGLIGGMAKGRSALRKQRQERKKTEQTRALSDLTLRASQTRPEEIERQYVRPEDIMMTGEELAPIYGTGTNVLARNGAQISPKKLYNDLGYRPIDKSNVKKTYYRGGDIPKAWGGMGGGMSSGGGGGAAAGGSGGGGFMNIFKGMMGGGGSGGDGKKSEGGGMDGFMSGGGSEQVSQIGAGLGDMASGTGGGQTSAGSTMGGEVGGAIGSIWGPVSGMVGKFAGNIIGGALDGNPRKMRRNRLATKANMQRAALNYGMGSIQPLKSGYMKYGGEVSQLQQGGELDTMWGGEAEQLSTNPHIQGGGETVMFKGNSHSESDGGGNTGIGVRYGNNPVEVEGGEPATEMNDELVVYGNLQIPNKLIPLLGDKDAKGKKFKNYAKDLSKKEEKQNKIVDNSLKELETLKLDTSFDKLKLSSLEANLTGANMKLKDIADKKERAANLQSAINDSAEEMGVDADALSKGKIKKAKPVKGVPKGQYGVEVPTGATSRFSEYYEDSDMTYNLNPIYLDGRQRPDYVSDPTSAPPTEQYTPINRRTVNRTFDPTATPPTEQYVERNPRIVNTGAGDPPMALPDETPLINPRTPQPNIIQLDDQSSTTVNRGSGRATGTTARGSSSGNDIANYLEEELEKTREDIRQLETKMFNARTEEERVSDFEEIEHKKSRLAQILNEVLPYLRPSNVRDLDGDQLLGEMFALGNNQLEPVQAQTFQPELSTPFEVSFQDALNANQSDFRSMQRLSGGNPAAQSILGAQKYKANQSVLGEQFRTNQAMKDKTYGENRQLINQSKLTNLQILDNQYSRQSEAKSKTKTTAQQALNSIASKYLQNDLENRRVGIMENMYNYRFDGKGRAVNMNAPTDFYIPVLDDQGDTIGYRKNPNTSTATPPFNPTTSNTTTAKYGLKIKKSNGGIVKALKNI